MEAVRTFRNAMAWSSLIDSNGEPKFPSGTPMMFVMAKAAEKNYKSQSMYTVGS